MSRFTPGRDALTCYIPQVRFIGRYPRESEEVCFYRRWFVCLSVCLWRR